MKTVLMVSLVFMLGVGTLLAGGDKVRGDNGQGKVSQVQVQDPPPFEEEDPDLLDWLWLISLPEEQD